MVIEFFLPMDKIPTVTHQEKKVNFKTKSFYEDFDLKEARSRYISLLGKHTPHAPLEGPIRLQTKWIFFRNVPKVQWKTTKPDTDNLIKLFKDCMTHCRFWKDDAQVASEITEKFSSPIRNHTGIWVHIETLDAI